MPQNVCFGGLCLCVPPRVKEMLSPLVQARGVFLFVLLLSLETVMKLCLLALIFTDQRIKKGKGGLT